MFHTDHDRLRIKLRLLSALVVLLIPCLLEPKAMDLLKAASDRLAAAKSMTFTAVASYEYPSRRGD